MEFMAFPAWELSVGEDGSDLETFSQEKKRNPCRFDIPTSGWERVGGYCVCVHVLKFYLRPFDVPWNTWLIRRCFAFIKSGYFPSAFNKNQHWSLTHRLRTAFAGYRGWDFSRGTGWNCSRIGNRRPETKAGRGKEGEAEQKINAELMLSEGSMAGSPGCP